MRRQLRLPDVARDDQRVVHLVRRIGHRPRFLAHALDRRGVEGAEVIGAAQLRRAPRIDGASAALLEGRIVEEGVHGRVEQLVREHRGLRRIARDRLDLAGIEPLELGLEAMQIDRFFQRVAQRLVDERMVRDFAGAR